jgi:hypothetical protein
MTSPKTQIHFFATSADWELCAPLMKESAGLQYILAGSFDSRAINKWNSILSIPNIGRAIHGDMNHEPSYLVIPGDTELNIRNIPQRNGRTKYAIDQLENPKSITLSMGGIINENCIISGMLGTSSPDDHSLVLFKKFPKILRSNFGKVKSFFVGPTALDLLNKGYRLTSNIKSPQLYDLCR